MELPLIAMRTAFYFADGIKTPDITIDAQETGLRLIPRHIGIHFGIVGVVKEALPDVEIVPFAVESITPKHATLVCVYTQANLLPKSAIAFLNSFRNS